MKSPRAILDNTIEGRWFSPDGGILPCTFSPSPSDAQKLVVLTGLNATGKSFFRCLLGCICSEQKWEFMGLSMEKRTGADYSDSCMRALMFGSERDKATGGISAHIVIMGIKTSASRNDPNVLFFDEPDLGLSDEYAIDAAHRIVEYAGSEAAASCKLVCVVTHRKSMLDVFSGMEPLPHHIHLGDWASAANDRTLKGWANRAIRRLNLEEIGPLQHATFLKIHGLLEKVRK
jgi:hypothetical protein